MPAVDDVNIRQKDAQEKKKAKEYSDAKRKAAPRDLKVGEQVLVVQKRKDKYSTRFGKDPMTIKKINGNQIVMQDIHGRTHRRNSSLVKRYHVNGSDENIDLHEEIEDLPTRNNQPDQEIPVNQYPPIRAQNTGTEQASRRSTRPRKYN